MNESVQTALRQLRLSGLAASLDVRLTEAAGHHLGYGEFLELLLQDELLVRRERLVARRTKAVEEKMLWSGAAMGMSAPSRMLRIVLPAALPEILTGCRTGLVLALITMITSEMIARQSGAGNILFNALDMAQYDTVFAMILIVGLMGIIFDAAFEKVRMSLVRWSQPREPRQASAWRAWPRCWTSINSLHSSPLRCSRRTSTATPSTGTTTGFIIIPKPIACCFCRTAWMPRWAARVSSRRQTASSWVHCGSCPNSGKNITPAWANCQKRCGE